MNIHKEKEFPAIALLWDESHIWGLMMQRALSHLHVPFQIMRSKDLNQDLLKERKIKLLIVPGGWASSKGKSLGLRGREMIRDYVYSGGTYLGFCGGAGLALNRNAHENHIGLCSWSRKGFTERLPNCSGHIGLDLQPSSEFPHLQTPNSIQAPVWWPSQFEPAAESQPEILAYYNQPGQDFWIADLPLDSLNEEHIKSWEHIYNINLHPGHLLNEPGIIWGTFGQGKYLLSYVHLETPSSPEANTWFAELLGNLSGLGSLSLPMGSIEQWNLLSTPINWTDEYLLQAKQLLEGLIQAGMENFLLCWRKPWLLGWRRGISGFALNILLALVVQALKIEPGSSVIKFWEHNRKAFYYSILDFYQLFLKHLAESRLAMAQSISSPEKSTRKEFIRQKKRLFGTFPYMGGIYKKLTEILQELIWLQIIQDDPAYQSVPPGRN